MKKFKELANKIGLYESGEHTIGGGVQNPSGVPREISAISDEGVYNIQRKSQFNRINAFLDSFSRKEYIDPRGAMAMLRAKLNIAGLDFEFGAKSAFDSEGKNIFPITRFGGTFGKSLDTPHDEFEVTDGISPQNDGKGFDLVIDVVPTANGVSKMNVSLQERIPVAVNPDTDIEDDETEENDQE